METTTQTLNKCLNKVLYQKQELLQALQLYQQQWIDYLQNTNTFDFKTIQHTIQQEYTNTIHKIDADFKTYKTILTPNEYDQLTHNIQDLKTQLLHHINHILISLKEKDSELQLFRNHVNLGQILHEDSIYLHNQKKLALQQKLNESINTLYIPTTITHINPKNVQNFFFYLYQLIKQFQHIEPILQELNLALDTTVIHQVKKHLTFLLRNKRINHSHVLVTYYLHTIDLWESKLTKIDKLLEQIRQLNTT